MSVNPRTVTHSIMDSAVYYLYLLKVQALLNMYLVFSYFRLSKILLLDSWPSLLQLFAQDLQVKKKNSLRKKHKVTTQNTNAFSI